MKRSREWAAGRRWLVAAGATLVLAGCADGSDSATPATSAAPSATCIVADLVLPDRRQVKLNVLNGTGIEGRERDLFVELGQRGFQMISSTGGLSGGPYDEVAVIRYGPRTVGAAWSLQAYFLDKVAMVFDIERTDDTVDLILGRRFVHLATPTEVNQATAKLGEPPLPPGTCAS